MSEGDNDKKNIDNSKAIWTQEDFERMSWHDCPLYAMQFDDEVVFDLDYGLEWITDKEKQCFVFPVSPATLVFHNAKDLRLDVELEFINGMTIARIERHNINDKESLWTIDLQEGRIILTATGYTQYLRMRPVMQSSLELTCKQRGGYGFKMKAYKT